MTRNTASLTSTLPLRAADIDTAACTFKDKKRYGKIHIVTAFPDIKVQEVNSFPGVR